MIFHQTLNPWHAVAVSINYFYKLIASWIEDFFQSGAVIVKIFQTIFICWRVVVIVNTDRRIYISLC